MVRQVLQVRSFRMGRDDVREEEGVQPNVGTRTGGEDRAWRERKLDALQHVWPGKRSQGLCSGWDDAMPLAPM